MNSIPLNSASSFAALQKKFGSPIKITHLLVGLDWGGAERLLLDSLPLIREKGFDVEVVALGKDGPIGKAMRERALKVEVLGKSGLSAALPWNLYNHLRKRRPNILHTHLFWPGILGRVIAHFTGVPCIISHEHYYMKTGWNARRFVESCSYRWADGIVAVSKAVLESRHSYIRRKTTAEVIPNGINLSEICSASDRNKARVELGVGEKSFVIGWVGRMDDDWKDLTTLLKAAAIVYRSAPDALWVLIGDGPDAVKLKDKAEKLGVKDVVRFLGVRSDVRRLYVGMDLLVLPSRSEGFSLVLVEAMASSLPVIASNIGGIPEVVENCVNGILVEVGDAEAIAANVESLFRDQEQRSRMGENGKRSAYEKFGIEKYLENLITFYWKTASKI